MTDCNQLTFFHEVLDLVRDWQIEGRNGHCLPVIRGRLLEALEEAANDRAQDGCTICNGSGQVSDGYEDLPCTHCRL